MTQIIEKFQLSMCQKNLSMVFISGKNNILYLTGLPVTSVAVNPVVEKVPIVMMIPAEGEKVAFAPSSLKQFFDDKDFEGNVLFYPSNAFIEYRPGVSRPVIYADNLLACVTRYIKENPIKDGKVGIDSAFMKDYSADCLNNAAFKLVDQMIEQQRLIKTEEEIHRMKIAAIASYAAMERVEEILKEGGGKYSENDLFYEARKVILNHRCQWGFTSVMAGHYGADIYHQPTDYIIQDGDFVRMDFGAVYEGYRSDVARTVGVGTPNQEYSRLAGVLREGVDLIINALKPGVCLGDLYDLCLNHVVSNGYSLYQHRKLFGHCVGIEVEEHPFIERNSDFIVKENMVFSVETPYYIKDYVGFSHEDSVVIRKHGAELLRYIK